MTICPTPAPSDPDPVANGTALAVSREGPVVTLTLNRPASRNALNGDLMARLHQELDVVESDTSINVVVITGKGSAFCAGADLYEMRSGNLTETLDRVDLSFDLHRRLPLLRVPVIAAVNGYALAGGCGLAMSCDVVIASDNAQFGYPEIERGLVAALVMVRLQRLVPPRAALELLLSGRRISAEEALTLGMINEVVPEGAALSRAATFAHDLSGRSATALSLTKRLFHQTLGTDLQVALRMARDVSVSMRGATDAAAGIDEFIAPRGGQR